MHTLMAALEARQLRETRNTARQDVCRRGPSKSFECYAVKLSPQAQL